MKQSIQKLMDAYPAAKWPEGTLRVFKDGLSDLPLEVVQAGIDDYITTQPDQWPPSLGRLRNHIVELIAMASGMPTADEAFTLAMRAIREWNPYNGAEPQYAHPALGQTVIAMGGPRELGMSTNESVIRGQFVRAYTAIVGRAKHQAIMSPKVKGTLMELADKMNVDKLLEARNG